MDSKDMTKQIIHRLPTGLLIGAVCAFLLVGVAYSAWRETSPDKPQDATDRKPERAERIAAKRNKLFSQIVS